MPGTRLAERLQDLLLDNDVLEDFLRQLSGLAAEFASAETGRPMLCSVRVDRRRQQMLLAASHPEARTLDGLQDHVGEGPGLEARQTGRAVMVPDTTMDPRWRRYQRAAAQRGADPTTTPESALPRTAIVKCALAHPPWGTQDRAPDWRDRT